MVLKNKLHKIKFMIDKLLQGNSIDVESALRVIKELDSFNCQLKNDKKCIVFLVLPWMMTAIPYQFVLFAYLCRYWGYNSCIVWNDKISYFEGDTSREQKYILNFLSKLKNTKMPIYKYSDFDNWDNMCDICVSEEKLLEEAQSMVIHQLRNSFTLDENKKLVDKYYCGLLEELPNVASIAYKFRGSRIVVPGGVCGNTSLFYHFSKSPWNISVSSLDEYISGNLRPAVHKDSFVEYKEYISSIDGGQKKAILKSADYEMMQRMLGNEKLWDGTSFQSKGTTDVPQYDILIAPNIEWDSAALNQSDVFATMREWIEETLDWLLKNTNYNIAIRQHPAERISFLNNNYPNYLQLFMEKKYKNEDRVCFYSAIDAVNTYDLIKNAQVILPWSSDVAIDAATLGKMSIVHSEVYYQDEPYAVRVHSKKEYFSAIVKYINNNEINFSIEEAKLDYFFHSHFYVPSESINSAPIVFNNFIRNNINDITNDAVLNDLLHSWLDNKSFMLLYFKRQQNREENKLG